LLKEEEEEEEELGSFADAFWQKHGPVSYSNVLGRHTVLLSGSEALGRVFYNSSLVQRHNAMPPCMAEILGSDILPSLDEPLHTQLRMVIGQAINTQEVLQFHLNKISRIMMR